MELAITYTNKKNQIVKTIVDSYPSISVFWKSVASFIRLAKVPSRISAESENNGNAYISIRKNGKGKEGIYTEVADETEGLSNSPFSERYLVNGNKAYVLSPVQDEDGISSFNAIYGQSDEVLSGKGKSVKVPYPIAEFWVKYFEKIAKGYKDRSRTVSLVSKSVKDIDAAAELFDALTDDAVKALHINTLAKRARNIDKISLTENQIAKAWKVFRQLKRAKRFKTFRTVYQVLISLLPSTNLPNDVTANDVNSTSLFNSIDSTLSDLENVVACKSSFADCNVKIEKADEAVKEHVLSLLPSDIRRNVEEVYAVHNVEKEARFRKYCERLQVTTTKELWHGSRNENWLNIIKNGLRIHPNAQITGKMFGDGIYFAPEAQKAYGYTSCQGTYWARGNSNYGFMGLFTTAYGNPSHDTNNFRYYGRTDYQKKLIRKGYHCLHALASRTSLRHDEIIFYHEDAMILSYLIKIKSR